MTTIAKRRPKATTFQAEQQQNSTSPESISQQRHNTTVVSDGQEPQPLQAISAEPWFFHPRSTHPRHAQALAREVALHWAKPASKAPPWLRESFPSHRPPAGRLWAYTTDSRGRVVRAFCADQASIAAYAELQRQGTGTCPIEGVWPPSITPGQPADSAHPYLLQLQESEPTPYPLADDLCDAAHDAASAINARLARNGLALTADDLEAVRDAVADALQTAEVVEVGR